MIKASELRIGNYVKINNPNYRKKDTNKIFHVLKLDSMDDSCNGVCIEDMPYAEVFGQFLKHIEPIELTEDIVIDLGLNAVELENSEWFYQDNKFRLNKNYSGFYYSRNLDIKYVHQLQNLYFALTGCELQYVA